MLIQFKTGNFLSFKDVVTFSMVGYTPIKEHENIENSNVFSDPSGKVKLLKSSVLYGANGSGKSNLLSAIKFYKKFILTSSTENQSTEDINIIRFLLSSETDDKPSFFEMIFYIDDIRYRYGFEVDKKNIHSEWLFFLKNEVSAKEINLFTREFQDIKPSSKYFKEGKEVVKKTRPNALYLSSVAQWSGDVNNISVKILSWIKSKLVTISGLDDDNYANFTISKFKNEPKFKTQLIEFFKNIKIGFESVDFNEDDKIFENFFKLPNNVQPEYQDVFNDLKTVLERMKNLQIDKKETKNVSINFLHKKFDETQNFIDLAVLDFSLQSKGTQKLFNIFGLWIDALEKGKVLIIDELDSRLHTLLTIELIKFFHTKVNKKSQLIFASHDTNLLKRDLFRRDQIWFTEKDNIGATDLYSLVEYKVNQATVRNDASFEKDYLAGKYGAIPFVGNIEKFLNEFLNE